MYEKQKKCTYIRFSQPHFMIERRLHLNFVPRMWLVNEGVPVLSIVDLRVLR